MKIFKMIMYSLCVLSALALSLYGLNYYSNEEMIKKVQDNVFVSNPFSWLGFMEPWVEYYNEGISLQHQKKYDEAIEKYDQALETSIPWRDSCAIRINKTLSMLAPIVPEEINLDNIDDAIAKLKDCQKVLTEDGCADSDGSGHDEDAQQLYDEIQDWIDDLEKQKQEMEEEQEQEEQEEQGEENQDNQQNSEDQQDQNQDQNQNQDENSDPQDEDQDQNGENGENDEDKDGDEQTDEDKEEKPDEGDSDEDEGLTPEEKREQELKSAFDDLQNQAFQDRIGLDDEDPTPGIGIVVEEYW